MLASWAVPRGVPPTSARNNLAVQTEDHPMEYASFSGVIPAGQYGAGTMTIWDEGRYDLEKWRDDEVIAAAETPDAHRVEVDWPEGQDHPSSVAVDPSERAVDEEYGYLVADVEVADAPG